MKRPGPYLLFRPDTAHSDGEERHARIRTDRETGPMPAGRKEAGATETCATTTCMTGAYTEPRATEIHTTGAPATPADMLKARAIPADAMSTDRIKTDTTKTGAPSAARTQAYNPRGRLQGFVFSKPARPAADLPVLPQQTCSQQGTASRQRTVSPLRTAPAQRLRPTLRIRAKANTARGRLQKSAFPTPALSAADLPVLPQRTILQQRTAPRQRTVLPLRTPSAQRLRTDLRTHPHRPQRSIARSTQAPRNSGSALRSRKNDRSGLFRCSTAGSGRPINSPHR